MINYAFLFLALILLIGATGCRQSEDSTVEAAQELELFENGKGLRLPEETFKALGVQTAEVIEKPSAVAGGEPVVMVPESAVIRGATGAFVYVQNGEYFTRTIVKTGAASNGQLQIVDGLYAGDVVVSKAVEPMWMIELYALRGGTPCCPVPKRNTAMN